MTNIKQFEKIKKTKQKNETTMMDINKKISNYKERKQAVRGLKSLTSIAIKNIRQSSATWLRVVRTSKIARNRIKEVK